MTDKQKIKDLEERVKRLEEGQKLSPPICPYVPPYVPYIPPIYPGPIYPTLPWYYEFPNYRWGTTTDMQLPDLGQITA